MMHKLHNQTLKVKNKYNLNGLKAQKHNLMDYSE